MTGVDDPYEVPADPDLRIDTSAVDLDAAVAQLLNLLTDRGLA
jgi:adenylylsulfate kinase-like enzyme